MDLSKRNKKVAIARWTKVHERERAHIPKDSETNILKALLCGFLAGDGSVIMRRAGNTLRYDIRFFPDDTQMLEAYCESMKHVYRKEPSVTRENGMFNVQITSRLIGEDLTQNATFGLFKWLPPAHLFQTTGAKEAWLKGFFSAEGYVSPTVIRVQTVNFKGMNEVSNLLNELDIEHRNYRYSPKRKNHSPVHIIVIGKRSARMQFLKKVGFYHSGKLQTLRKALDL